MPPAYQQYFEPTYGLQGPTMCRERGVAAPLGHRNGPIQYPGRPTLPPQDLFPPKKTDSGSVSPNDSISHTIKRMDRQKHRAKRQRPTSPVVEKQHPAPPPSATSGSQSKPLPRRARKGRKRPSPESAGAASDSNKEAPTALANPRTLQAEHAIAAAKAKGKSGGGGKGSTTEPRPAPARPEKAAMETHTHPHVRIRELEQKLAEVESENFQLQEDNEELARGVRRLGRRIRDDEQERLRREAVGRAFKDKAYMMSTVWSEIMQLEI